MNNKYKSNLISLKESVQQSIYEDSVLNENINKNIKDFFNNNDYLIKIKEKSKDIIKNTSKKILIDILNLYYVITEKNIPLKDKLAAISCIIYILSPFDAVSDFLPGGYYDDIALLLYVLDFFKKYITDDIIEKSEKTIEKWKI